jgi:hypothetical protein
MRKKKDKITRMCLSPKQYYFIIPQEKNSFVFLCAINKENINFDVFERWLEFWEQE